MKNINVNIDPTVSIGVINRNIYGQFAEMIGSVFYRGLWADDGVPSIRGFRADAIEALKAIRVPIIRWPGGCFAESYDWRDGIGDPASRPTRAGWWYASDGRTESNRVGIHEFIDLCRLTGAEPYIAANVSSMTPLELRHWIEYCNFPRGLTTLSRLREENGSPEPFNIKYWGLGNENWMGGGNMNPRQYAEVFSQYATIAQSADFSWNFCKNALNEGAIRLDYVACGANNGETDWTAGFMANRSRRVPVHSLSIHYYCGRSGDVLNFRSANWYSLLNKAARMDSIIASHDKVMREYDPEGEVKIAVDEWGTWHEPNSGPSRGANLFEQQNTMRDALCAALTLNIFNNRCDRVVLTNIAQICNVLQSLFLTVGKQLILTPTYYVYDLFKTHMDCRQVKVSSDAELLGGTTESLREISVSASEDKDGIFTVTAANLLYDEQVTLRLSIDGFDGETETEITLLGDGTPNKCNTPECPEAVKPTVLPVITGREITAELPPASLCLMRIKRK